MQWMQVQSCGDVALEHDQCAMHWKVIQEFSVQVSLPTSAIHLLMILGKSLHLSVLLFMLQMVQGHTFSTFAQCKRMCNTGGTPSRCCCNICNNRIMQVSLSPPSFLSQVQVFVSNT